MEAINANFYIHGKLQLGTPMSEHLIVGLKREDGYEWAFYLPIKDIEALIYDHRKSIEFPTFNITNRYKGETNGKENKEN